MMRQSPTSLQTFLTCPRQYEAKYITHEVKFEGSKHTEFGTLLHAAIEYYLKEGRPLPSLLLPLQPTLDRMRKVFLAAEKKLTIDFEGKPCAWDDSKAYQGCIVDAMLQSADGRTIICVDWKTGKKRDAQTQHDFIKKCTAAHYPEATKIVTVFVYLFKGESDVQYYKPGDSLLKLNMNMGLLMECITHKYFQPKPGGLCKQWCDVVACEFNGRNLKTREQEDT